MTDDQLEYSTRSIADAVVFAVRETPSINAEELSLIAVNVAQAIAAGVAVANAAAAPLAPRS